MLLIFFIIQARRNSLVIMPMKMQPQPNQAKRLSCSPARDKSEVHGIDPWGKFADKDYVQCSGDSAPHDQEFAQAKGNLVRS